MSSTGGEPQAQGKRVPGPRYALDEHRHLFRLALVTKTRATLKVCDRLGVGEPAAEAYILRALRTLVPERYCHTKELPWDPVVTADVYGLIDQHGDWYLKFYMDAGRFVVCSCHEPEYPMTCQDGTVVRPQ